MSITQKLENDYKNIVENIKKLPNSIERDLIIGSLVEDLGKRCISAVSRAIGICREKVKSCYEKFKNGIQLKLEFRGRKSIVETYPNIKNDIESVIENYKIVDSHFKTETLSISMNPTVIIEELIDKYGYPPKFACYNSIAKILKDMGYKYHKIPKSEVVDKIPETDAIFENVNDHLESIDDRNEEVAFISTDDKATKKIGNFSDNGYSWQNIKALDHDTAFKYAVKPFGILDLKTNETFVTCTPYNSTSAFKVDCIEKYIVRKNKHHKLKKLVVFLDNGPENSSRRKLWLKKIVKLSIKYNLIIELVYYPPYHSKYNKIERVWAHIQMEWRRITIDSLELLIDCLNKMKWKGINIEGNLSMDKYEKGIKVSDYEMETEINPHIIREEGLEKWSLVITPYAN